MALLGACHQSGDAPDAIVRERIVLAPAATRQSNEPAGSRQAVFAGGCFWGVEGVFSHVRGVTSAVTGFSGGAADTARYDRVSLGDTGHAEAVRVTYDPRIVRYDQLLRIFFSVIADPTTHNRQGPDSGTQYRSAMFPLDHEQRAVASAYLEQMGRSGLWPAPIVTQIEPFQGFYPAEPYHQDFMARNPQYPYILAWDTQKVKALERLFPGFYSAAMTRD